MLAPLMDDHGLSTTVYSLGFIILFYLSLFTYPDIVNIIDSYFRYVFLI